MMKRCSIVRAADPPPLSDAVDGTPWTTASWVELDEFPWGKTGRSPSTTVRPLYDDEALYLQYVVEDGHSYAQATKLNGPVWEDSCVELFATVAPRRRPHYFNFEVNCVGTFRLGFGPDREHRDLIDAAPADAIRVETSVEGPTKAPSPDDDSWWVAVALPFEMLATFTGASLPPDKGTVWRGNFHRLAGQTDPEYAAWNSVDAPDPDFHRPADFGRLVFE
jgi:hypothetical protein